MKATTKYAAILIACMALPTMAGWNPKILNFTSDKDAVGVGDPVTFSWSHPQGDEEISAQVQLIRDEFGTIHTHNYPVEQNATSHTINPNVPAADYQTKLEITASPSDRKDSVYGPNLAVVEITALTRESSAEYKWLNSRYDYTAVTEPAGHGDLVEWSATGVSSALTSTTGATNRLTTSATVGHSVTVTASCGTSEKTDDVTFVSGEYVKENDALSRGESDSFTFKATPSHAPVTLTSNPSTDSRLSVDFTGLSVTATNTIDVFDTVAHDSLFTKDLVAVLPFNQADNFLFSYDLTKEFDGWYESVVGPEGKQLRNTAINVTLARAYDDMLLKAQGDGFNTATADMMAQTVQGVVRSQLDQDIVPSSTADQTKIAEGKTYNWQVNYTDLNSELKYSIGSEGMPFWISTVNEIGWESSVVDDPITDIVNVKVSSSGGKGHAICDLSIIWNSEGNTAHYIARFGFYLVF